MKNLKITAVLTAIITLIVTGCGGVEVREGAILGNRFAIETANAPVNSLREGQEISVSALKDIKGISIDPKNANYWEMHMEERGDDGVIGYALVANGQITKDGKILVIKVHKAVTAQVVYMYLFNEQVNLWAERVTLKVTTVQPTTNANATDATERLQPNANPVVSITQATAVAGRELTANIRNLPTGATPTYQWFEDDGGWKVITGATNAKYTATPGVVALKFKVKVTVNGADYEAEAVVNP